MTSTNGNTGGGYSQEKFLHGFISNENGNPALTDTSTLSTLKLLSQLSDDRLQDTDDLPLRSFFNNEIRFFKIASKLIKENSLVQQKYGGNMASALALSELVKQRASERAFNKVIDSALTDQDLLVDDSGDYRNPFQRDSRDA